jgi:hypothetical protein
VHENDHNPLGTLPAFGEFASTIKERCTDGPTPINGMVIGSYDNAG